MIREIQNVYVVAAKRTPVGKAPRGTFRNERSDDLLTNTLRALLAALPQLDKKLVQDVVVGCAMPEGEQGLNVARTAAMMAGLPDVVPATTINRFCASGLDSINIAASRIASGEIDCAIAGGVESMSLIPSGGAKVAFHPKLLESGEASGNAYGMGITAERVAERFKISRPDQDAFAYESHKRAIAAIERGEFCDEIFPYTVQERTFHPLKNQIFTNPRTLDRDEGPRADTTIEALAKLKPVFSVTGTVTAGNSSQMSDGSAAVFLASESFVKQHKLTPLARFMGYAVAGVAPDVMGIGPVASVPLLLKRLGLTLDQVDWIELNEAFAAQSLAVLRELKLDPAKVNPLGGAIALGHPLGATGSIRTATVVHGLRRHKKKYGMVTMCVGGGMGATGMFEAL